MEVDTYFLKFSFRHRGVMFSQNFASANEKKNNIIEHSARGIKNIYLYGLALWNTNSKHFLVIIN